MAPIRMHRELHDLDQLSRTATDLGLSPTVLALITSLGHLMDRQLIEKFAETGKLAQSISGLTRDELLAKPGPGDWSIQQVVIHMADSDEIAIDRMKRIIIEDNPTQLWADETAYAEKLFNDDQSIDDAITIFETGRRQFARVLRKLPDSAFDRFATHNKKGKVTLAQMVADYTGHLDYHLKFILAKRERLGKPITLKTT